MGELGTKPARQCKYPRCAGYSTDGTGYCPVHVYLYVPFVRGNDDRPSAARRGYGRGWRQIRERVLLAAGIARADWPKYDVDHNPPYNPEVEPRHEAYVLIPRLHADHSRKTRREGRSSRGDIKPYTEKKGDRRIGSDTHIDYSGVRGSV